ncbi:hypothetical protein L3Y34_012390 [Caenorhabditis briggsae]|uniref:Uncharacterized protein n=1 Tax=Caenorhabditis briggsae TaxID=6238 RepID=A0AAE8ZP26_CAEBR|nr:hypothetical protein L3Y34_012390 [Caenorhabditis briggsae]
MKALGILLQPLTILLTIVLLVLIIFDAYSFAWTTDDSGIYTNNGISLSACTPWNILGCPNLWNNMDIRHRIALILHLCLIPLTAAMVLVSSLAVFTRAMRKQTSIIILILISWIVFFTLITDVALRFNKVSNSCIPSTKITITYNNHWQVWITFASLLIAFFITQIFAFGGYFRPMITMLSFEGHHQRYDYPRVSHLEKNMVSVKEIDNF